MNYLGIEFPVKNMPELDPGFIPFGPWAGAYLAGAKTPVSIAIERQDGMITVRKTFIRGTPESAEADYRYVERTVKFLLWSIGGFRIYLLGVPAEIAARLRSAYVYDDDDDTKRGERWFDVQFMYDVFDRILEIVECTEADFPAEKDTPVSVGGHTDGCRIGFDAGGSDRKVSAVIDGKCVYSEEVVWHPKTQSDPQYHFDEIVKAFKTAASHMPRVDAIGVSSAGVFLGNAPMVSSLFIKVSRDREVRKLVHSIFDRAALEIGPDVPIVVANDGDVTALAGAMGMGRTAVMGIAMGTSEAVGYVDGQGRVLGWYNELAFAPVDLSADAMEDEWSHDIGAGCKYFSQDAVIKLAPAAGIALDGSLTPAEKLKAVQALMEADDPRAQAVFRSIGCYLAHTMDLYARFYDVRNVMVLGRVMSGKGGDTILAECNRILADEYPALAARLSVMLPDEKTRRIGQAFAAASLPQSKSAR